ncbi:hypothetical protein CVT26_015442 [Gymnopilus dilepis]|uniref:Uncharacterized protein n=1 Tax=Gymnopilus dilepis TaxID=231916 RepID=A0A409YEJ1_9AGAR|nr:hypothetical protein CVT26_015442 [Gymnopilus dilepis]
MSSPTPTRTILFLDPHPVSRVFDILLSWLEPLQAGDTHSGLRRMNVELVAAIWLNSAPKRTAPSHEFATPLCGCGWKLFESTTRIFDVGLIVGISSTLTVTSLPFEQSLYLGDFDTLSSSSSSSSRSLVSATTYSFAMTAAPPLPRTPTPPSSTDALSPTPPVADELLEGFYPRLKVRPPLSAQHPYSLDHELMAWHSPHAPPSTPSFAWSSPVPSIFTPRQLGLRFRYGCRSVGCECKSNVNKNPLTFSIREADVRRRTFTAAGGRCEGR